MDIVTVFNYPNKIEYNVMCCAWIMQIRKYTQNRIIILSKNNPHKIILEFTKIMNYKNIIFSKKNQTNEIDFSNHPDNIKATHNINFKMFNLCSLKEPFIFIDADAFLINEISTLEKEFTSKPMIAINHQKIPGQTDHLKEKVLNSGVMLVSDPNFLSWKELIKIFKRDRRFIWPGTDQSLINSFCKENNYDYTHPNVGFEWNSWAKYTVWEGSKAFCKGLQYEHPVYINHYWNNQKPWNINCPIYKKVYNILGEIF